MSSLDNLQIKIHKFMKPYDQEFNNIDNVSIN